MARFESFSLELVGLQAEGGDADALFDLGMMYSIGSQVEYDLVKAHKWFNLAASKGNDIAAKYRKEISMEMSKLELREAQKLARLWRQKQAA